MKKCDFLQRGNDVIKLAADSECAYGLAEVGYMLSNDWGNKVCGVCEGDSLTTGVEFGNNYEDLNWLES